ncbi:MAG: alpha/beta hydrolase [Stagnimonas sp.]|nr:alpha/beta hydrolase [Stagnimonas sp.]
MNVSNSNGSGPTHLVVFAHGKESGPWGTKITQLAEVAKRRGYAVLSPDYSFTLDPQARVAHLLQLAPRAEQTLVLVGSSMGGYVSAMACAALNPTALFLMAPALYFPGWDEEPEGIPALTSVVHGWQDDIVPPERGQRFATRYRAALHLIDSGHTLNDQLPLLCLLFDDLLRRATEITS